MNEHSSRQWWGFVLAEVVALSNLAGLFLPTSPEGDDGPPMAVVVFGAVVGVVMAALLAAGWRRSNKWLLRLAALLMVLVALTAVPAFSVPDVPAWARLFAGLYIVGTVVALVLLFSPGRRPAIVDRRADRTLS